MATFKRDGYLYTNKSVKGRLSPIKKGIDRGIFLVKWKNKFTGYILQHINSIDVPAEFVGKRVRIKLEVIPDIEDIAGITREQLTMEYDR